ncbi:MAG: DNA polymerase Y family protein [Thermoanaerobaculia bacterium]
MIACLFVPLFPLAARLRSEPELKEEAVAIFEGNGNAARVVAATRKARKAGIEPGMTLPQARARIPKLVARGRDRECERTAHEALLEVAESFSPRVEDAREGVVYVDLEGHPRLVDSRQSTVDRTKALAGEILRAAERASVPARVGVAASKLAARIAAGLPGSPTVVPEGEESRFLAPLPLERLGPHLEIAATLERWGLHSIGEFAKLPEGEVSSRLGEIGRELHAAARGLDPRPLEPYLPPPSFSEGMDLEWPLASLEPFLFVANAALERLVLRLEARALACTRLEVTLKLDPDGHDARAIALPAPTREVKTLLTLVRLELEARPPGSPVAGFTFAAHPDQPRRAQLSLFGPAALSPDRLATTIARLAALLGDDRVGSPRSVDGHRPERYASAGYAPAPPPSMRLAPRGGRGLLAVRVLRPAVALEVITSPAENHSRPHTVRSPPDAAPLIAGQVRVASGPWSLEEGWWSDAPADRDYWDVELSDGGLYRIYRERRDGAWFSDGVYD